MIKLILVAVGLSMFCVAHGQTPSRILKISGDRQIAVNTNIPSQPFVVKTYDSSGNALAGIAFFIAPGADPGLNYAQDEFGFRGFNTIGPVQYTAFGSINPAYYAVTDSSGTAQASSPFVDYPPSAFTVVAIPQGPSVRSTWQYFSVVAVRHTPAGRPSVVLEYFNTINGHYFNTISQVEIDALEAGKFVGWKRSTGAFIAYETQADAPEGAVPVCRFFSSKFTSHFYTADVAECNLVERDLGEDWVLETRAAFYINVPDKLTGSCGAGLQPIHRMFNNRAIPNHRYVADAKLRDRMSGAGWVAEGFGGANAVMLCTPA